MKKKTRKVVIGVVGGAFALATAGVIGYAVGAKHGCEVCDEVYNSKEFVGQCAQKVLDATMTKVTFDNPDIGSIDMYAFNDAVNNVGGVDALTAALAGLTSPVEV